VLVAAGLPDHRWSDVVRRYGDEEDAAIARGDLDAAVEANLRMWVDGPDRAPEQVDPEVRRLVGEMQRRAFELQVPMSDDVQDDLLVADVGTRFAEIRVPVLVIVGGEDVSDMHEIADRILSGIPGATKVVLSGTAHVPGLEVPVAFDDLVLPFLA
jgi:3-oxoadipate enol-lactonase